MKSEELFSILKTKFTEVLIENGITDEEISVTCQSLTPEEAIGQTKRKDFPILTGKDIMIQAEYKGCKGQAFTDAPSEFVGTLSEVSALDIIHNSHSRGLFIAVMNAVMDYLGLCDNTVHCRTDGPEKCAVKIHHFLQMQYPGISRITLVGYQPAMLQMLAENSYQVRVLDLNPDNIGQIRYGVLVEDGAKAMADAIETAQLILCTGSTLCNGTIADYILPDKEVLFFGITAAGAAALLGLKRICYAEETQGRFFCPLP